MASIEGLSEEHCEALTGAQIGDLILVESYPKRAEGEQSEADSDDGSEGPQSDGDDTSTGGDEETVNEQTSIDEQDGESEDDVEGSETDETSASDDGESNRTAAIMLYVIHDLSKDDEGEIKTIILREVKHCLKPAEATISSFYIYGNKIKLATPDGPTETIGEEGYDIQDVIGNDEATEQSIQLKPSGDDIREILFHGRCPAQCNDGWIATQEEMHALMAKPIRLLLLPYAPTCPVCIGKSKTQKHQSLREFLEDSPPVDIGAVVEFLGALNPRRKALGYSFKQFDEREWGMLFDDMLSEDEDENGPNGEYYEDYPEALDPNANPTYYAASDAAIAALAQKSFGDVANGEESAACAVCITKFTDDTTVAELPCGHYFDVECAEKWLKTSNACPTCRKKLQAVEVAPAESDEGVEDESVETGEGDLAELESDSDTKSNEIQMDGDDVVMSDIEDATVVV